MKVLLLAQGGKAHAIIWKLVQSSVVSKIFCTYNNPAIKDIAEFIDIRDNETDKLLEFIKENEINLTIVESDVAIMSGIADILREQDIPVFGSGVNFAKLEKTCNWSKKFFHKFRIPTAHFATFDKEAQALDHARKANYPLVIKFDTRSANCGSIICETFSEAQNAISYCLKNLYKPIVIEDFIIGKHVTYHVITDGYNALPLSNTQVYKKSDDGNAGFMTEGMGAYSPVTFLDQTLEERIAHKIFFPMIDGFNSEKLNFCGVIKANIVVDDRNNPYIVGVNVSFGDPDAQTILPLLEDDLFAVMYSASIGALADDFEFLNISDEHSVCVVLTSQGYPGKIKKGEVIEGLDEIVDDNILVFHSGTEKNLYQETVTTAGRVLSVVATGSTLHKAKEDVYDAVELIEFKAKKYRKDIAKQRIIDEAKR